MGFIKGRAYPIIAAMAKDGNEQAKKLLEGVDSMDQDQVDSMISEIFGSKTTGDSKDWKKDLENKNFNNLAKGESKGNWKSDLEDEEFEQELQKRTGGKYSTKQKFGNYETAVESNENIPEIDEKPFKYKSQGKEKVTIKQIKPFTEEQKNQFNQNYATGIEVTNDVTGETFVVGKKEMDQAKTAFPSLKQKTITQKVKDIAKQVKGEDGTYKIVNGKPKKVELNKGFSVSFFRPEIKNQEAEEIEKIIGDQLGSQYVGVYGGNGELSYNVDQKTANFMAYMFNQKSVWDNKLQKEVDNPNYDPNKKVDYKQAIKELKQLFIDKDLKGA